MSAENICVSDTTVKPRKDMYLFEYEAVNEAVLNALDPRACHQCGTLFVNLT